MNNLEAYKMDGLGNDFVIFDNRKKSISLTKNQIVKISRLGAESVENCLTWNKKPNLIFLT